MNGPVPRLYVAVMDGERLTGNSPKEVMLAFCRREWKAGRRLEPDWEDAVWQALAVSHPRHIKKVPGKASSGLSMASAVGFVRFMAKHLTDRTLVATEEAHRRAAICRECPFGLPVLGCSVCKDALQSLIHPPEWPETPEGCAACGCWMPAKVWIQRAQLGAASEFPYWEKCWMREPVETGG